MKDSTQLIDYFCERGFKYSFKHEHYYTRWYLTHQQNPFIIMLEEYVANELNNSSFVCSWKPNNTSTENINTIIYHYQNTFLFNGLIPDFHRYITGVLSHNEYMTVSGFCHPIRDARTINDCYNFLALRGEFSPIKTDNSINLIIPSDEKYPPSLPPDEKNRAILNHRKSHINALEESTSYQLFKI